MRRDREAEPHEHACRVRPHGQVDETLQLGERDDLVYPLADVATAEAVDGAVEVDVLAAGEVGVKARADTEERADVARDRNGAARRAEDAGDQPQESRLAGPV